MAAASSAKRESSPTPSRSHPLRARPRVRCLASAFASPREVFRPDIKPLGSVGAPRVSSTALPLPPRRTQRPVALGLSPHRSAFPRCFLLVVQCSTPGCLVNRTAREPAAHDRVHKSALRTARGCSGSLPGRFGLTPVSWYRFYLAITYLLEPWAPNDVQIRRRVVSVRPPSTVFRMRMPTCHWHRHRMCQSSVKGRALITAPPPTTGKGCACRPSLVCD